MMDLRKLLPYQLRMAAIAADRTENFKMGKLLTEAADRIEELERLNEQRLRAAGA